MERRSRSCYTRWTVHWSLWEQLSRVSCFIAESWIEVVLCFLHLLRLIFQVLNLLNLLWRHILLKWILMRVLQFIQMGGAVLFRVKNLAVNLRLLILNYVWLVWENRLLRSMLIMISFLFLTELFFQWLVSDYNCFIIFLTVNVLSRHVIVSFLIDIKDLLSLLLLYWWGLYHVKLIEVDI